jgi:hypothetical protein
MTTTLHLDITALEAGFPHIKQSPPDNGQVECIVIRPKTEERVSLQECDLSPELGLHGDNWPSRVNSLSFPDGSPNPKTQVTLMNSRTIDLIAQSRERWPLAGDNLFVDLDISEENLQPGQRLAVGSAILEITEIPHTGCDKFVKRFGADALKFVNSKEGRKMRLRGIYAQIIQAGKIKVGDVVSKI